MLVPDSDQATQEDVEQAIEQVENEVNSTEETDE